MRIVRTSGLAVHGGSKNSQEPVMLLDVQKFSLKIQGREPKRGK